MIKVVLDMLRGIRSVEREPKRTQALENINDIRPSALSFKS